jgi:DNA polymerase I-like protein with 3'-5' exonuclease and polymerase domains
LIIAVDTETTGTDAFHGCRPFMITVCDGSQNHIFEGLVDPYTRNVTWEDDELEQFDRLARKASRIVMHNANFDIRMLSAIGVDTSYMHSKLEETLIAAHCLQSGHVYNKANPNGTGLGLKALAIRYLDLWDDDETELEHAVKRARIQARMNGWCIAKAGHPHFPAVKKQGTSFWKMDYWLALDACRKYAVLDVERTLRLWSVFRAGLLRDNLWEIYRSRIDLLPIAYDMQTVGKNFYVEETEQLINSLNNDIEHHGRTIRIAAGIDYRINFDKKSHLVDLLHTRCKIPVDYRTDPTQTNPKGQPAMDKAALKRYTEKYNHPVLRELSHLKRKQKKRKDLISLQLWLDENHRTHSNLNITGTRETRQSSSAPNDQNNDKSLKYLFGPPPGYVWICTDMVAIELRIWAYACGNAELISFFEKGISVHYVIMEIIFPEEFKIYKKIKHLDESALPPDMVKIVKMYSRVKNGTFSRIYGASNKKTNETYHGGKDAPDYCSLIDRRFPEVGTFTKTCIDECMRVFRKEGVYAIKTLGGYRLDVPVDESYVAPNFKIQGTAGQIMGDAMVLWSKHKEYRNNNCHMISQVHDGLDTEVPITPNLPRIIDAKCMTISQAGKKYIPTCDVTWKLLYNPLDETNTIIQEIIS